jgi:NTE family protein
MTPSGKRVAVVLGGGGMKGLAHVGVIKVLEALGVRADEYIGSSVGSLIAALAAGGMKADDMMRLGSSIRREEFLDDDFLRLLLLRSRVRSLFRGKKFHDWLRRSLPVDDFARLAVPLYAVSVEINTGVTVVWGSPGFTDCPVHDAVYASCAVPGVFPPKRIGDYHFIDGAVSESLPVSVAVAHRCDAIIAVNLQYLDYTMARPVQDEGVISILGRANTINGHAQTELRLEQYASAPIILVRPRVADHGMLDFTNMDLLVKEGIRAAKRTLTGHPLLQ